MNSCVALSGLLPSHYNKLYISLYTRYIPINTVVWLTGTCLGEQAARTAISHAPSSCDSVNLESEWMVKSPDKYYLKYYIQGSLSITYRVP